ncbi:hypothetical protein MOQ50_11050 [Stenotrophomonas maltophilia]|nr:hypothetical protein [Stenotrophomonas maltophilia]
MTTDNKTLADVQPGGRVRLGDQAERARFEAWAEDRELGTAKCSADGMNGDYADLSTDWCWAAWQAALSAQPSPGGQHARAQFEEYRGGDCERDSQGYYVNARTAQDWAMWQAALAARQPVTMDDALTAGDGTLHGAIDHWQERALRAEAELAARQPVGEPVAPKKMARAVALDLMHAVYEHHGWKRAEGESMTARVHALYDVTLDASRNRFVATPKPTVPPAQDVDLGKLQRFDVFADEGPGLGGMSVDYEESATGTWVRFDDVKALIDGKAVQS